MANWDIFHSDRLEVERNLAAAAVRSGIARGEIAEDDLVRPAGSGDAWTRLSDHPALSAALAALDQAQSSGRPDPPSLQAMVDDDDDDDSGDNDNALSQFVIDQDLAEGETIERPKRPSAGPPTLPSEVRKSTTEDLDPLAYQTGYTKDFDLDLRPTSSIVALDVNEDADEYDPGEEDEEAAEFTFTRGGADTVEELDLAAMVDVAFQLVLFFLVTASTVMFKTLEVPKPNPEKTKGAATQGSARTLEDLQKDYILVEIDSNGGVKIDHEPGPNDFEALVAKLRELRGPSSPNSRNAMLLTADSATLHKYAVMAYDAANEIGLKIAIAQPKAATPVPPVAPKAP